MKSLKIFFHEQTILNFPFLSRLVKRYKFLVIAVGLCTLSYTSYLFFLQNTIYSAQKRFRVHVDEGNVSSVISGLFDVGRRQASSVDIKNVGISRGFHELLATSIINHPDFDRFNLSRLNTNIRDKFRADISKCENDKNCLLSFVTDRIGSMVSIEDVPEGNHTFALQVRTIDEYTTRAVTEIAGEVLIDYRLKYLNDFTQQQASTTRRVLDHNRELLNENGFRALQVRLSTLKREQEDIRLQFRDTFLSYQKIKLETESLQEHVALSRKLKGMKGELQQHGRADRLKRLEASIEKLKGDINALEISFRSPAAADLKIVETLKEELERRMLDYDALMGSDDQMYSVYVNPQRNIELEYKIASDQFKLMEESYQKMIEKTRELASERDRIETTLETLMAKEQLVKTLEQRMLHLNVTASTISPDISFFDINLSVQAFKRMNIIKYVLFSLFFSCFLLFVGLVLRYMTDRKIYDHHELSEIFEGIPVLGEAPSFRKSS